MPSMDGHQSPSQQSIYSGGAVLAGRATERAWEFRGNMPPVIRVL